MADEAELNFFRLLKAFLNVVNEALRMCFIQQWNTATGQEWENDTESGQSFIVLERMGKKISKLFTSEYAKTLDLISRGDVAKWDSTTLFFVLLYSKSINLTDPSKGYRKVVVCRKEPFTLGEHIDHLREIRNTRLFHADEPRIDDSEFTCKMKKIITAVLGITGKEHELVENIIELANKGESVFISSENFLWELLEEEKQNTASFYQNLEKLEDQVKSLNLGKKKSRKLLAVEKGFKDERFKKENTLQSEEIENQSSETLIVRAKNRIKITSEELKVIQNSVIEVMYPNKPEYNEDYQHLINTSNRFSYEFDWENFNAFINKTLLEESDDNDMILFAKIQLTKGLSHQGRKDEALKLLNELVGCVYKAKNSAVILARIFYRLAYIFHDLKDTKKANQNILLAEQILVTNESYEDCAEIQYAKANISMATSSVDDHHAVIDCLNNTIEASDKSIVDMSVLERQALLRNSLAHLGFLQHTIKTDVKASDVRAASELLDKFVKNCRGVLSKRNQLFQLICQSLLAYYENNLDLAIEYEEKACSMTVKHELLYEMKQIAMLKSHLKSPHKNLNS